MSRSPMIRRIVTAHVAALLALSSTGSVLADGPVGGSHTYRPAPRVVRPRPVAVAPIASMTPAAEQVLSIDLTAGAGARVLDLPLGKSAIIELPVDVRDMLVTNPLVADAVLRSPRRIYVLGMTSGATDAVFFDAAGRKILQLNIRVAQDISLLSSTLRAVLPMGSVQVVPLKDSVILTGVVMNAADSEKASRIAAQFVASPEKVLNMLSIAGKDQVMLEVRIVEVQRNVIKQLGVSSSALFNDGVRTYGLGRGNTFGVNGALMGGADLCAGYNNARTTNVNNTATQTNQNGVSSGSSGSTSTGTSNSVTTQTVTLIDVNGNPVTIPADAAGSITRNNVISSAINAGTTSGSSNALTNLITNVATTAYKTATGSNTNACLQAFERVGLIRTLAEPNLTVLSGEAGKFLAGGEFPVPTGQDATGKITIEFKPYGVGLGYVPVVLSGGRISLKLSTEVSELSSLGAFSVSSGSGSSVLTVPGLMVRRAETTVELPSGGSMMIAGLLQQTTKQTIDSLPGLTSMPVLGSLFRSRDYLNGETELVIIITPYIVDPTRPQNLQTPADGLKFAGDMSTTLLGRLNQVVKAPAGANAGRAYQGPVGYVIE